MTRFTPQTTRQGLAQEEVSGSFATLCAAARSALACFETRVFLVDDVDTAFPANHAVVAVAGHERFERIFDLHVTVPTRVLLL